MFLRNPARCLQPSQKPVINALPHPSRLPNLGHQGRSGGIWRYGSSCPSCTHSKSKTLRHQTLPQVGPIGRADSRYGSGGSQPSKFWGYASVPGRRNIHWAQSCNLHCSGLFSSLKLLASPSFNLCVRNGHTGLTELKEALSPRLPGS